MSHNYNCFSRKTFRENWLVNLTGEPDKWRAIDWVVEWNNLHIKVCHVIPGTNYSLRLNTSQRVFGGQDSNKTKEHIIKESILVDSYRHAGHNFEWMFGLSDNSSERAEPRIKKTIDFLVAWMHKNNSGVLDVKRRSVPAIPDVFNEGLAKCFQSMSFAPKEVSSEGSDIVSDESNADMDDNQGVEEEDLLAI
jgi:hypothetical protein